MTDHAIDIDRYLAWIGPFFTGHRVVEMSASDGGTTLYDDRLIVHAGTERTERRVT